MRGACWVAFTATLVIAGCGSGDERTSSSSGGGGEGSGGGVSSASSAGGGVMSGVGGGGVGGGGVGGGGHAVCGDSITQAGEDCDLGIKNGVSSSCCTADCKLAKGTVCRPGSGDACDPDEVCDGASVDCPADVVGDNKVVCRTGSGDACDPDEYCPGVAGAACPVDLVNDNTTVCRAGSGDACDPDEHCPGVAGAACPADMVSDNTVVCRAGSGDACDPSENCTGVAGAACPADVMSDNTVVCRAGSGDACDPSENCPGVAGAACPSDVLSDNTVVCRAGSGDVCDPDEHCPGVAGASCPADVVNAGMVCGVPVCPNSPGATCSGVPGEVCPGCTTLASVSGKTVLIVESQSFNAGQAMDTRWQTEAMALGLSASIAPQTILDSNTFFATTDILIVSSGVLALPAARVTNVLNFFKSGKNVYLQGEYLVGYDTNIAFKTIVEATGGTFTWTATVNDDLAPISPTGCLGSSNTCVSPLSYFWYGATGTFSGPGLSPFLTSNGKPVGWTYYPPGLGKLIFDTDQDWIRDSAARPSHIDLMRNILMRLGNP